MSFSCQKGKFDRFFNRLDRPVEESQPDRFPSLTAGAPAKLWSLHREPSPSPSGQTTIKILQLKLYCSDKINNMEQYDMAKNN